MIQGIHHTAISTGDIERALRFYRDLLGFKEVWSSSWEIGTEVIDRIVGLKDSSARVSSLSRTPLFAAIRIQQRVAALPSGLSHQARQRQRSIMFG